MNSENPRPRTIARRVATPVSIVLAAALSACNPLDAMDLTGGDVPVADGIDDTSPTDLPSARFQALYSGYLQVCRDCHRPGGPGRTSGTEQTLDLTTVRTAYDSITKGSASGMVGNVQACNGVPLIGSTYETSLLVATIDEDVRAAFQATGQGPCDEAAITDMTLKVEAPSPAFLADLRAWIDDGAP